MHNLDIYYSGSGLDLAAIFNTKPGLALAMQFQGGVITNESTDQFKTPK